MLRPLKLVSGIPSECGGKAVLQLQGSGDLGCHCFSQQYFLPLPLWGWWLLPLAGSGCLSSPFVLISVLPNLQVRDRDLSKDPFAFGGNEFSGL